MSERPHTPPLRTVSDRWAQHCADCGEALGCDDDDFLCWPCTVAGDLAADVLDGTISHAAARSRWQEFKARMQ